jgi:hypothetical protein
MKNVSYTKQIRGYLSEVEKISVISWIIFYNKNDLRFVFNSGRRAHVLLSLLYVCILWCPTHVVFSFVLCTIYCQFLWILHCPLTFIHNTAFFKFTIIHWMNGAWHIVHVLSAIQQFGLEIINQVKTGTINMLMDGCFDYRKCKRKITAIFTRMRHCMYCGLYFPQNGKWFCALLRKRGNQNPSIEEEQTTQCSRQLKIFYLFSDLSRNSL